MLRMNLILVYDKEGKNVLMCKRAKEPYKGKYNLVGGKLEPGESAIDSAYRELYEETGISQNDIELKHLIDFSYPCSEHTLEVFTGKLEKDIPVVEEVNQLEWMDVHENDFFDQNRFAGEGNIGHMIEQTRIYKDDLYHS